VEPDRALFDVFVVGGGPAGAAAALTLARRGLSVALCEAGDVGRLGMPWSLSPGVSAQLSFLGLNDVLRDAVLREDLSVWRRWGGGALRETPGGTTLLCDAVRFSQAMCASAEASGVRMARPARLHRRRWNGRAWDLEVLTSGAAETWRARFLVDAAGRGTAFRRRTLTGTPTIAVAATWRDARSEATTIVSASKAWFWSAPTGSRQTTLVGFTDPQHFRTFSGGSWDRYAALVREAGVELPGTPDREIVVCNATPYLSASPASRRLLRVGDADAALDPLSSTGVQAAIQSALAAGPVVATLLDPHGDANAALAFWEARRRARVRAHQGWSAELYAEAAAFHRTPFWTTRTAEHQASSSPPAPPAPSPPVPHPFDIVRLDPRTAFVSAACLVDDRAAYRECVAHPTLTEPVAFVDGVDAAPLLRLAATAQTAADLVARWSARLAPAESYRLLSWAWRQGVLSAALP